MEKQTETFNDMDENAILDDMMQQDDDYDKLLAWQVESEERAAKFNDPIAEEATLGDAFIAGFDVLHSIDNTQAIQDKRTAEMGPLMNLEPVATNASVTTKLEPLELPAKKLPAKKKSKAKKKAKKVGGAPQDSRNGPAYIELSEIGLPMDVIDNVDDLPIVDDLPPAEQILQQDYLIPPIQLAQASGKNLDALAYSRQRREAILRLFNNQVPQSIMLADKASRDAEDLATGTYEASGGLAQKRAKGEIIPVTTGSFEMSGRGAATGALSKFPQNIGRSVVLLYSQPNDLIVDPFAGHNSRMELCIRAGRDYEGQDLSHSFCEFNAERAKKLRKIFPERTITLHEGTSEHLQMQDNSGDFTLTSPPYWDIEYYGSEPEQMGFKTTYDEFLAQLARVAKENYRVLKAGSYCVWFINDFRRKGKFYAYHVDTLHLLNDAGFVTWDIMVTDFGRTFRSAFVNQIVEQRILPKKHEYGWIVRKPGWEKK